jgi:hypothetical protein
MRRIALIVDEARSHMAVKSVVFAALAGGLAFQPHRFDRTPAYATLLAMLPQQIWALIYGVAAVLVVASVIRPRWRPLVTVTHTFSITLLAVWWVAFLIHWLTDSNTTIVNVLTWGVFLYLATRSAWLVDSHREHDRHPGGSP